MVKHHQTGADSCACGQIWPCDKARGKFGKPINTGLKPGDCCYRVVLFIAPDDNPDVWRIESAVVKTASDRMITFEDGFRFGFNRQQFPPSAIGRYLFRTDREAVQAFADEQRELIAKAKRTIANAEQAIQWAALERVELEKAYGNG